MDMQCIDSGVICCHPFTFKQLTVDAPCPPDAQGPGFHIRLQGQPFPLNRCESSNIIFEVMLFSLAWEVWWIEIDKGSLKAKGQGDATGPAP